MAAGGSKNSWIKMGVGGGGLLGIAFGIEQAHVGPEWLVASLLAVGGLLVVFASCDLMIQSVEGIAALLGWNKFVAGTMAGLASNIPELVMLGFVIAAGTRVGFIVVALTLHIGAMAFGIYAALLPRDTRGHAALPTPLVKLSTDLYMGAGAIYLAWGLLMLMLKTFEGGKHATELTAGELYAIGSALLVIEVVAVVRLVKRFSVDEVAEGEEPAASNAEATDTVAPATAESKSGASVGRIIATGLGGIALSVVGGHAVGDFAGILVGALAKAGYSEMLGALILSGFAAVGPMIMIGTAHAQKNYDVALANASGAVTQVPFVVLPIALFMIAAFSQTGVVPALPAGGAMPIDLQTTSVVVLGFPPMMVLWKAIQDDGSVNWLETVTMIAIFGLTLFFLAQE